MKRIFFSLKGRILIFLSVFGPATIAAMADNDAAGVATYSLAGAKLGYPILFLLPIITILLGVTQEMGIRLALISRKGLADLIREFYGIRISLFIFFCIFIANIFTIIVDLSAVKIATNLLNIPTLPSVLFIVFFSFIFVAKGSYKSTQNIFLISTLFYLTYIFSAFKSNPNWGSALSNLVIPNGVSFDSNYLKDYLILGLGVVGTTITPWGQFFISSFAFDKKIEQSKVKYAQLETIWGAFLTNFFSYFMIVATASTLFVHSIPLISGEQAALAIKPFAGQLASTFFAIGILNAGFMGVVVISLTTAYAFSEFFGYSGSLDTSFTKSRSFYIIFLIQLIIATVAVMIPGVSLFKLAITAQVLNAMMLPLVFYFLIKFTSNPTIMNRYINSSFQRIFAIIATIIIIIASVLTTVLTIFNF
ncbi:MAG: hypothetical protein US11_C0004G0077 [Candidatus Roizmanbacteria bacterium GW2011_GWA2_36_23]|uniref:Natural resistance-associated macrophage protein n=1 Tax=Candidatus Roizmanbacteria bacterium GW2011_GWA2_36_23 TaxID=1618480 RepID=A0A0G0E8E5_9BACT|nr:MAG: hypothetical protein US11_C0004G0077 [Candidatus Roizmanbacteria bacterium GW2011_GWA2_36_23]